jgi:hypothetical protein
MKHNPTPTRRGRPRTGRVEAWRDRNGHTRYRARITLLDGTSQRIPMPANTTKEQATKLALEWQTREDASRALHGAKVKAQGVADGETTGAWFARYTAARASKIFDAERNALRWKKYIAPHIASIPVAALARTDIERVRDGLDQAIAAKTLHPKSARNVCVWLLRQCAKRSRPRFRAFVAARPTRAITLHHPMQANRGLALGSIRERRCSSSPAKRSRSSIANSMRLQPTRICVPASLPHSRGPTSTLKPASYTSAKL